MPHKIVTVLAKQRVRLLSAILGSAAALAALAVAELLHVENPYWAAMTALIVIQPTRAQLLEKSLYRLAGTVAGSITAVLLMLQTQSPALLTLFLSIWVAACVGLGNVMSGQRSYGMLMASCTCAVITMSAYLHPSLIHEIAFGRVAGIMIGIAVATVMTAAFTPSHPITLMNGRLRILTGETLEWLGQTIRNGRAHLPARPEGEILFELAELEQQLSTMGLGSKPLKARKRRVQSLIALLLSLIAVGRLAGKQLPQEKGRESRTEPWRDSLACRIEAAADALERGHSVDLSRTTASLTGETDEPFPLLGATLSDMVDALPPLLKDDAAPKESDMDDTHHRLTPHRDWREAGRSALRAGVIFASIGSVWAVTGWSKGPVLLMALSIMISIFSTKDHPVHFVGNIFVGAAIGSAAAVFCRSFLLGDMTDPLLTSAILAPFLLAGVFAMQHRRTVMAATDATLFFLFIAQPGVQISVIPADLAVAAVAGALGVGSAWLAYRYLVPISPAIRMRSLSHGVFHDLAALAAAEPAAANARVRERLRYRVIRLVALSGKERPDHGAMAAAGVAALGVSAGIDRLRADAAQDDPSPALLAARRALEELAAGQAHATRAARLLDEVAHTLYALPQTGTAGQPTPAPLPCPVAVCRIGSAAC